MGEVLRRKRKKRREKENARGERGQGVQEEWKGGKVRGGERERGRRIRRVG